ncbi:hypothetical protein [Achromobacter xylosoxidans]|uniref:hypothetical protein n=1 Tax=Alcaligenes xylosoxydans xylosoxydans TaxID=85698 RepID=UPI0006C2FCAB|nr:hypothetical protein [Achromobacter xylosoxidans]CUJ00181.1 Uncharacterised protein [Achromobacter xylosoxidans]CUJ41309.1 Uncharacterised protein [Achromobacter xylosoxidans]CUR74452.1 hypothetical protein BN2905_34580 [Achromobacter xylosoxidans]
MKLDRAVQKVILDTLASRYPDWMGVDALLSHLDFNLEHQNRLANVYYLEGHGLVEAKGNPKGTEGQGLRITAKGLDFLEDDGGIGAILGVVTIKLHDDTIKHLIEAKILASDLPAEEKQRWTDQLRSLPAKTIEHLVMKLVDRGLDSGSGVLATLGAYIGISQ